MTNDPTRCPYYEEESENVKDRYSCQVPAAFYSKYSRMGRKAYIPNNEEECREVRWPEAGSIAPGVNVSIEHGQWVRTLSHGLPKPICRQTQYTRDNHLGNTVGGFPLMLNWTLPNIDHEHCIFRIRFVTVRQTQKTYPVQVVLLNSGTTFLLVILMVGTLPPMHL